jgi:hypothetical protein
VAPDGSPVELYLLLPSFGEPWLEGRRTWLAAAPGR